MGFGSRLLSLFRSPPPAHPQSSLGPHRPELQGGDFVPKREIYPLLTFSGWTPDRIMFAVDQHDQGIFGEPELLYQAMRKEGLIASGLNTRVAMLREFPWDLVTPKEAPEEFHAFADILKKDWQQVMSDETRGEIDERLIMFGFCVCSVYWTFYDGQKQMRLKPWTHSSIVWRWDWYAFQGTKQDGGVCRIENDGREWVVFSKGGLRPWLKGALRELAYVWFGLMTGDGGWLSLNDGFGRPIKKWKTPRLMRESKEALDGYDKVRAMRAADTAMCPQDEKGYGYDLSYVQANAQGFQTFSHQLQRYDDRVAIILLGHNLSQRVSSGSLAATKEATGITRLLAEADARIISAGFDAISAVWARANFGESWEDDNPDLTGGTEAYSWKLVFDTKPPEDKKEASQTAQSFGSGMAALAKQMDLSDVPIDKEKSAERAGFILLPEEKREAFRKQAEREKEAAAKQATAIAEAKARQPVPGGDAATDSRKENDSSEALDSPKKKLLAAGDDLGPGVMIALFPRPDEAQAVALPAGESVAELHVTLGYLGRAAELPPKWLETLHQQAAAISQQSGPLVGVLGGLGRFSASESSEGRDVIYATPNVIGLTELRQKLAAACAAAGVPFRANHGFTPHMTLAYIDPGAPVPAQRLEPQPVHFDAILVCAGPSRWEFPLTGSVVEVLSNQPVAPPPQGPLLLSSGESADSAAGLIEGQQRIDAMADEDEGGGAPALAAVLAALAAAADWGDLRGRLADIVRGFDLRDAQSALREKLRAADAIGALSVDHDLTPAARAEVDAADRRRGQADKIGDLRGQQERASLLARAATAYALFAVARHLWEGADRAAAHGQPLEVHKAELTEALRSGWGAGGALWDTARAEPLQHAFTHARVRRLNSEPLRAIFPYWQFLAVLDGATTPACRRLGNPPLVRPAGSPDFPVPPLHWHCRSTVRGLSRAEGEPLVNAAMSARAEPGFGSAGGYPAPDSGPEQLLAAYRSRV